MSDGELNVPSKKKFEPAQDCQHPLTQDQTLEQNSPPVKSVILSNYTPHIPSRQPQLCPSFYQQGEKDPPEKSTQSQTPRADTPPSQVASKRDNTRRARGRASCWIVPGRRLVMTPLLRLVTGHWAVDFAGSIDTKKRNGVCALFLFGC